MWWHELRKPFLIIVFMFVCLFVFTKIFGPIPFYINNVTTNKQNLFTVSGTGEATAVPDTALLNFGVTKNSSTVESGKDEVNKIVNQLTEDLSKLGIDKKDIKTTNFSVNPNYDYNASL